MSRAAKTPASISFRLEHTFDRPAGGPLIFAPYPHVFFVETEDGVSGPHPVSTKNLPAGYYLVHEDGECAFAPDCGTLTHLNGTTTRLSGEALTAFRAILSKDPATQARPQWVTDFEAAAKQAYPAGTYSVYAFRRADDYYGFSARGRECFITETTTLQQAILSLLVADAENSWFGDARAHLDALERCSINARR